jgi:hypothetical protein
VETGTSCTEYNTWTLSNNAAAGTHNVWHVTPWGCGMRLGSLQCTVHNDSKVCQHINVQRETLLTSRPHSKWIRSLPPGPCFELPAPLPLLLSSCRTAVPATADPVSAPGEGGASPESLKDVSLLTRTLKL